MTVITSVWVTMSSVLLCLSVTNANQHCKLDMVSGGRPLVFEKLPRGLPTLMYPAAPSSGGARLVTIPQHSATSSYSVTCGASNIKVDGKNTERSYGTLECKDGVLNMILPNNKVKNGVDWNDLGCSDPVAISELVDNNKDKTYRCNYKRKALGFRIAKEVVVPQIRICYNDNQKNPIYTIHKLRKRNFKPVLLVPRGVDDMFDIFRPRYDPLADAYTNFADNNQRVIVSRGHMSPKSDFIYPAEKVATFDFNNMLPQWKWKKANAAGVFTQQPGEWEAMEILVQKSQSNDDYLIVTAGYGVDYGTNGERHLLPDGKAPVPSAIWKVVIDTGKRTGIAFVGMNNRDKPDTGKRTAIAFDGMNNHDKPILKKLGCSKQVCKDNGWGGSDKDSIPIEQTDILGQVFCCEITGLLKTQIPVLKDVVVDRITGILKFQRDTLRPPKQI